MAEKQSGKAPVGQNGTTVRGPQCAGTTTLLRDLRSALQMGDPQ